VRLGNKYNRNVLCLLAQRVFLLSFAEKKVGKESRPKKKLQFFRVGATMSDSATALPG
jgi:hypothetical protein